MADKSEFSANPVADAALGRGANPQDADAGADWLGQPNFFEGFTRQPIVRGPYDDQDAPGRDGIGDSASVDDLAALGSMPGRDPFPSQNIESDLAWLRADMPFLPIIKTPRSIVTAFMALANTPTEIRIPDGAVMLRFSGDGDYYVSFEHQAVVPSATMDPNLMVVYKPEFAFFYVGAKKTVSVVSAQVNRMVQVVALFPRKWIAS